MAWDNAFKAQWELFLRHVAGEGDFRWNLLEGAKACSWRKPRTRAGTSGAGWMFLKLEA